MVRDILVSNRNLIEIYTHTNLLVAGVGDVADAGVVGQLSTQRDATSC